MLYQDRKIEAIKEDRRSWSWTKRHDGVMVLHNPPLSLGSEPSIAYNKASLKKTLTTIHETRASRTQEAYLRDVQIFVEGQFLLEHGL